MELSQTAIQSFDNNIQDFIISLSKNENTEHLIQPYLDLFNKCEIEEQQGLYYYLTKVVIKNAIPTYEDFQKDYFGFFEDVYEFMDWYIQEFDVDLDDESLPTDLETYLLENVYFEWFGHCFRR